MKKLIQSPFFAIFVVWLIFSFPYFFQGKVPFPSSYQVNFFSPWSAYEDFASPYKNGATPDVIGQIYPWKFFTITSFKQGVIPLWNPYSFSGTYHLANYQSAVFSPLNLGFFIFPFVDWWSIMVLLQPLLAGVFMLLFIRSLKLPYTSQIISSLAFMFCGFITTWMMYATLGYAILFLPLALYSIEKYIQTRRSRYSFLLFFTFPLSFFSGHFQISIYFLLFVLYYVVIRLLQKKEKNIILLFLAIFLGLFASAVQLLPSIEAYSQSLRSGIFQKTEAIPWVYIPTLLSPDFFGNPVTRNSWFGHYAEWNAYIGIIPLFFAFFSLFCFRKKEIIIFVIPLIASLMLAFATPFLDLLVALKIPVLSTSAASRIIVLYSFSASVLAAYGIHFFVQDLQRKQYKKIISILIFLLTILVLLWGILLGKFFMDAEKNQIAHSNLRLPTLIFVLFTVFLGFIHFFKKKKIFKVGILLIVILAGFDSLRFAMKWQPFEPKNLVFAETPASSFYSMLPKNTRVMMNSGAEGIMHYQLQGVEGYDAVYINRYGSFISSLENGKVKDAARSVVQFPKQGPYATQSANLLGIRYIIHKVTDGQNVWEFPFWRYNPESLKLIYDDDVYEVLENTNAFPKAFLVQDLIVETIPQEILDTMFDKETNLLTRAVIEKQVDGKNNLGSGSAEITSYQPNNVRIKTITGNESFLVLMDTYSPGWNAYVNNNKVDIYRTNHAFRGIFVPEGENIVEFKYEPKSFIYGMLMSTAGFFGAFIIVILRRKNI